MARGLERGDVFLYPFDQPDKQRPVVVLTRQCSVNLFNVVTVPKENLGSWVSRLSPARMAQVCVALRFATGCDCEE